MITAPVADYTTCRGKTNFGTAQNTILVIRNLPSSMLKFDIERLFNVSQKGAKTMMNGNATATAAGRAVNRGLHLDAATDRLLAIVAGRRFDGNRSMTMRAALRLAAATWGVEAPPTQGGET